MYRKWITRALVLLAVLLLASAVQAQDEPTPAPSEGNTATQSIVQPEARPFSHDLMSILQLPPGFQISVFAEGLENPRMMAIGADGTVYVTRRQNGDVVALPDQDGDGVADSTNVIVQDIPLMHGITIQDNRLLLAANTTLYAADIHSDGTVSEPQVLLDDLPDSAQHTARTMAFGPDGMLYMNIGSPCDACRVTNEEHATLLQIQPDFSSRTVFAEGLRHTIGFDWNPVTGELWGMDHGMDHLGDDIPPEELNLIQQSGNYGWPFCYGDKQINTFIPVPPMGMSKEEFCATSISPVLTYQAHSAPMGMVFYDGAQFPEEYVNDAFVAMHGSWNRSEPTGYSVVRIHYDENGQPSEFEDFLTGFLIEDGAAAFGRPVGLLIAPDGSLLVSDDSSGVIYRVSYVGE